MSKLKIGEQKSEKKQERKQTCGILFDCFFFFCVESFDKRGTDKEKFCKHQPDCTCEKESDVNSIFDFEKTNQCRRKQNRGIKRKQRQFVAGSFD